MQLVKKMGVIFGILLTAFVAAAAEPKIAYVDMAKALNDVEDGKDAKARLKSDFDDKQKKLDKMQNELKTKKDEFESRSATMKPEVRQAKQEELQRQLYELQQTYMQLQKELIDRESKLTQDIAKKLRNVIEKIGDRDSYTYILDIGDTVLYYKRHMDITDDIVKEYNKLYSKK